MRRKRWILLLLGLVLLLPSCITVPAAPGYSDATGTKLTSGVQPSKPKPPVPLLSAEELQRDAEGILTSPSSGIVDISGSKYSYEEMAEDLQTLATVYPEHFSYHSIGKSVAGRDLYVAVLGNPSAPRQIVVSAAIHAREYMTVQLVMKQMEFYLSHYDNGSYDGIPYAELFEQFCFYIVPMTNPDGVMISQEGETSLPTEEMRQALVNIFRTEDHSYKTMSLYFSHWKANARGVDLNRNYDALWEQYNKASQPQSSQYKGPSPASEPETQAMVNLINGLENIACVLCVHSQGEVIYWNCGQNEELGNRSLRFARTVAKRNGYHVVMEQNNDASLSDWCELKKSIVSITVETGNVMCPLPIDQFEQIWLKNYDLLPLTARYFLDEA